MPYLKQIIRSKSVINLNEKLFLILILIRLLTNANLGVCYVFSIPAHKYY